MSGKKARRVKLLLLALGLALIAGIVVPSAFSQDASPDVSEGNCPFGSDVTVHYASLEAARAAVLRVGGEVGEVSEAESSFEAHLTSTAVSVLRQHYSITDIIFKTTPLPGEEPERFDRPDVFRRIVLGFRPGQLAFSPVLENGGKVEGMFTSDSYYASVPETIIPMLIDHPAVYFIELDVEKGASGLVCLH